MNENKNSDSPEKPPFATRATRTYESHAAPGAAMRTPQDEMSLSEKRHQSLPRATALKTSEGVLPLKSRGLLAGGGFLALLGLKNWRSFIGLGMAGVGSGLIYSGLKNNGVFEDDFKRRVLNTQLGEAQRLTASIVVERPVDEVFEAWSECSNLALCMKGIDAVERINSTQWHFKAGAPQSKFFVEWNAEVVEHIDNELLAWRTMPGSDINHEGVVEFHALPDGLSAEVHCTVVFLPPAGKLGEKLSEMTGDLGNRMLGEELERFKYFMEPHPAPALEEESLNRLTGALQPPTAEHSARRDLR